MVAGGYSCRTMATMASRGRTAFLFLINASPCHIRPLVSLRSAPRSSPAWRLNTLPIDPRQHRPQPLVAQSPHALDERHAPLEVRANVGAPIAVLVSSTSLRGEPVPESTACRTALRRRCDDVQYLLLGHHRSRGTANDRAQQSKADDISDPSPLRRTTNTCNWSTAIRDLASEHGAAEQPCSGADRNLLHAVRSHRQDIAACRRTVGFRRRRERRLKVLHLRRCKCRAGKSRRDRSGKALRLEGRERRRAEQEQRCGRAGQDGARRHFVSPIGFESGRRVSYHRGERAIRTPRC